MNEGAYKFGRMTRRMAPMFIVVFCFSLLLNAFLDYSNFKRNHTEIERSRFAVVINDLQDTVEYALNLGVAIQDFSQLQQMIENTQKRYPEIDQISVIDTSGNSIYDTNKLQISKKTGKKWLQKALAAKELWHDAEDGNHVIGVPVVNSINIVNATLVISYSQKNLNTKLEAVRNGLAKVALGLMVFFSIFIYFGLKWINKRYEKDFQCMTEIMTEGEKMDTAQPATPPDTLLKAFLADSSKAYSNLEEIEVELAGIEGKSK